MALSPAEKQRRYRERQKKDLASGASATDHLPGPTFDAFLEAQDANEPPPAPWNYTWPDLCLVMSVVDIDIAHLMAHPAEWEAREGNERGVIARAEQLASFLIGGGTMLSELINRYKLEKIERAISEIERADLSDPDVRGKALNDLVELKDLQARLNKRTGVKGLHAIY